MYLQWRIALKSLLFDSDLHYTVSLNFLVLSPNFFAYIFELMPGH